LIKTIGCIDFQLILSLYVRLVRLSFRFAVRQVLLHVLFITPGAALALRLTAPASSRRPARTPIAGLSTVLATTRSETTGATTPLTSLSILVVVLRLVSPALSPRSLAIDARLTALSVRAGSVWAAPEEASGEPSRTTASTTRALAITEVIVAELLLSVVALLASLLGR